MKVTSQRYYNTFCTSVWIVDGKCYCLVLKILLKYVALAVPVLVMFLICSYLAVTLLWIKIMFIFQQTLVRGAAGMNCVCLCEDYENDDCVKQVDVNILKL